jgi:23S rRNA (pseudouridine1915-N3)-methyltransferase
MNEGKSHVIILIGGADGLSVSLRKQADFMLSFGRLTWPHMMVRAMLAEQLYRTRQIIAGHPYHRA